MATETRTVHFKIDPALRAYVAWVDAKPERVFNSNRFKLFAAGYRAREAEEKEPATATGEAAAEGTG